MSGKKEVDCAILLLNGLFCYCAVDSEKMKTEMPEMIYAFHVKPNLLCHAHKRRIVQFIKLSNFYLRFYLLSEIFYLLSEIFYLLSEIFHKSAFTNGFHAVEF